MARHAHPPRYAKLRCDGALPFYPGIDAATWYLILSWDDLGVRIDLGPGAGRRWRFVFWADVETRDSHPSAESA